MRYKIEFDEEKSSFYVKKLTSSTSGEYFKTRRLAEKYCKKLQRLAITVVINPVDFEDDIDAQDD